MSTTPKYKGRLVGNDRHLKLRFVVDTVSQIYYLDLSQSGIFR